MTAVNQAAWQPQLKTLDLTGTSIIQIILSNTFLFNQVKLQTNPKVVRMNINQDLHRIRQFHSEKKS